MARMVATKAALSIRVDALSDAESRSDPAAAEVGITNRVKLESRLRALEHQNGIQSTRRVTTGANGRQQPKFDLSAGSGSGAYNANADSIKVGSVAGMLPTQPEGAVKAAVAAVTEVKEEKRAEKAEGDKKDKKKKRKSEAAEAGDVTMDGDEREGETKEERRARKEAKKAVSRACVIVCNRELTDRPRRRPRARTARRRARSGQGRPRRTAARSHRWRTAKRRRRRRSGRARLERGVDPEREDLGWRAEGDDLPRREASAADGCVFSSLTGCMHIPLARSRCADLQDYSMCLDRSAALSCSCTSNAACKPRSLKRVGGRPPSFGKFHVSTIVHPART